MQVEIGVKMEIGVRVEISVKMELGVQVEIGVKVGYWRVAILTYWYIGVKVAYWRKGGNWRKNRGFNEDSKIRYMNLMQEPEMAYFLFFGTQITLCSVSR